MSLGYDNLMNHYNTNFALIQHHKYTLQDLENMMPFERQIYVTMLINYLQEEKERMEHQR